MELTLEEIRKQIRELSQKERVILDAQNEKFYKEQEKHYFDNVHNRVFINETHPYNSGGGIKIVKATNCIDFHSSYNSCDCITLDIEFNKDKTIRLVTFGKDTYRVDSLTKEATEHDFEYYRGLLVEFSTNSIDSLNKFKQ
jgi:hypothetical protein